jgi:hypothetical protein
VQPEQGVRNRRRTSRSRPVESVGLVSALARRIVE